MKKFTRKTTLRQAAILRLREAKFLKKEYPSGSIYLGGYSLECMFKSYICSHKGVVYLEDIGNPNLLSARSHNLEYLLEESNLTDLIMKSKDLLTSFSLAAQWTTNLRYSPNRGEVYDAIRFIAATEELFKFLDSKIR